MGAFALPAAQLPEKKLGFRALESLKGSFAGVGSELARSLLGLGHSSSLPVEEDCAFSGMGFRAPESLKGGFAGVGSECSPLGLGHSSSLPVEEAYASSGMGFRAPESLKGSFAGYFSVLVAEQ